MAERLSNDFAPPQICSNSSRTSPQTLSSRLIGQENDYIFVTMPQLTLRMQVAHSETPLVAPGRQSGRLLNEPCRH